MQVSVQNVLWTPTFLEPSRGSRNSNSLQVSGLSHHGRPGAVVEVAWYCLFNWPIFLRVVIKNLDMRVFDDDFQNVARDSLV